MHKADFKEIRNDEVVKIAEKMKMEKYQLTVITGYADKEGKPVISYSYDVGGNIQTYKLTGDETIPSITGVYGAAAEWFEEEIAELMGIEFEGLDKKDRLFLPEEFDGSGQIIVSSLSELAKNK